MKALLFLLLLPLCLHAQVPEIDNTFGNAGLARIYSDDGNFGTMESLKVDHSGRLVIAARILNHFRVHRFLADGTPDITLGVDTGTYFELYVFDEDIETITLLTMRITPDNGMFVGVTGSGYTSSRSLGYIFKYTEDGVLDSTFAEDGIFQIPFDDKVFSVYIDLLSDGSIIAAGDYYVSDSEKDMYLCKVTPAGILDTSFADDGTYIFSQNDKDLVQGVEADDSSNVFLCARSYNNIATQGILTLNKYLPDGTPDVSYGDEGQFIYDYDYYGWNTFAATIMLTSTNNIAIYGNSMAGLTYHSLFIWTIGPDGTRTDYFGDGVQEYFDAIETFVRGNIVEQNDGKFIAVGSTIYDTPYYGGRFNHMWRFNADGSFDPTFGTMGYFSATDVVDDCLTGKLVALSPENRIIYGGTYTNDTAKFAFDLYGFTNDDIVLTGMADVNTSAISLFPNPTQNNISFNGIQDEQVDLIEIYNMQGILLFSQHNYSSNSPISMSGLPPGTYMVFIQAGQTVTTMPVIKL